uniref:Major sperm protein n=1 Tax=Panagrolaimus superbus TaxID=310955 RepID=A0A914YNU6_9BILA
MSADRAFLLNVDPKNEVIFNGDPLKELTTILKITNKSESKQAYKVKCTRNDLFRIRPPSGILDFNASIEVQVSFKPTGDQPESDKHHIGIYHIPAPNGASASGAWAEHYGPPQGEKRLKICFENS